MKNYSMKNYLMMGLGRMKKMLMRLLMMPMMRQLMKPQRMPHLKQRLTPPLMLLV
jgi:hypothetical protein